MGDFNKSFSSDSFTRQKPMLLSEFDVPFDETLIAEYPMSPRDHARLLVVPKNDGPFRHHQVQDLPSLLTPGDVLVLNDTKVIPARLRGTKLPGGGKVELLLVRPIEDTAWEVLLKGHVKKGQVLQFCQNATAVVKERGERTVVQFAMPGTMADLLKSSGEIPLPPYIKRQVEETDAENYQTVYAKTEGAVAAPTAGLHFTEELLANLEKQDIQTVRVTLHVGPGTFKPVTVENIEDHLMDVEWYEVSEQAAEHINAAKGEGRRIVAVGTTAVRTLEASAGDEGAVRSGSGDTRLFITPGFKFKIVDAMLTNFHFPRTTLIMLVSALAGQEKIRAAYEVAVKERYRFYSYGDAMLLQ